MLNSKYKSTSMNSLNEKVQKITELIATSETYISDIEYDNDIVVFLGMTKSGKSTLLSYLMGNKVLASYSSYNMKYCLQVITEFGGVNHSPIIGLSSVSQTMFPERFSHNGIGFWDLPGFDDNRGEVYNIATTIAIQRIVAEAKAVSFVLVVDYSCVYNDDTTQFISLLNTVSSIVPNFDALATQGAIAIVFTKCVSMVLDPENSFEKFSDIKHQILDFISSKFVYQPKLQMNELGRNFLKYLVSRDNLSKIGVVFSPDNYTEPKVFYLKDAQQFFVTPYIFDFNDTDDLENFSLQNSDFESYFTQSVDIHSFPQTIYLSSHHSMSSNNEEIFDKELVSMIGNLKSKNLKNVGIGMSDTSKLFFRELEDNLSGLDFKKFLADLSFTYEKRVDRLNGILDSLLCDDSCIGTGRSVLDKNSFHTKYNSLLMFKKNLILNYLGSSLFNFLLDSSNIDNDLYSLETLMILNNQNVIKFLEKYSPSSIARSIDGEKDVERFVNNIAGLISTLENKYSLIDNFEVTMSGDTLEFSENGSNYE